MSQVSITTSTAPVGWLRSGAVAAVVALGLGVYGHAMAATTTEVDLASSSQALKFCKGGTQKGVAYFNGTAGDAQYVDRKCSQAVPKKAVSDALLVTGSKVSECKLATAKQAIKLCNEGGMGEYDIAYIKGPAATVIGGPGYGCTTNITTLSIGNAICK
jgi:hypothetical protein